MWLDLLLRLSKNDSLNTGGIKKEDLDVLEKEFKEKESENGTTGASIFSQGISFDVANSLNYFVEEDEEGIKEITTDKPKEELTAEEQSITEMLKEMFSIDEIKKTADVNNDGKLEDGEIKNFLGKLSELDGESKNISVEDFGKLLSNLDVELSTMISKLAEDIRTDLAKKEEELTAAEQTEEAPPVYDPEFSPQRSYNATPPQNYTPPADSKPIVETPKAEERTTEVIQKEISDKETKKGEVISAKDQEIQAEQEKYDKAVKESMEKNKIDEEVKKEYETQKTALETEITNQDKEINLQEGNIQNHKATIEAKTSAIDSISSQIGSLESDLGSIQDSGDAEKDKGNAEKRQDIQGKIDNLNSEKKDLETAKKEAEDNLKLAEEKKATAQEAKAKAETEKSNLLQTLNEKFPNSGLDKVQQETQTIKTETETKISNLKNDKEKEVGNINGEIQTLKTELAQMEQKEKTNEVIKANSNGPTFDFGENMTESQKAALEKFKENYEENKERYEKVAEQTGVPAEVIAALHWRESSGNFSTYMHNGDPLGSPTTHVPAGISCSTWEESAIDAFSRQGNGGLTADSTDLDQIADYAERYNGLGYRNKGVPSPYVWAGTTNYSKGKYVADGQYDPNYVDQQLGVMIMLKSIM